MIRVGDLRTAPAAPQTQGATFPKLVDAGSSRVLAPGTVLISTDRIGKIFSPRRDTEVTAVSGVTLRLAPEGFPLPFPASIELPLFIVLLAAVLFGVVIGLFLELARERRHRKAERMYHHEARTLTREVKRLAQKAGEEDDDILGLKSP